MWAPEDRSCNIIQKPRQKKTVKSLHSLKTGSTHAVVIAVEL